MPTIQLFISIWEKSHYDIYFSPPHVSVITENIQIEIIRFARYNLFLACNSILMTDSMYFGKIQIYWNLNEHCNYVISATSVIWQIAANYSPFQSLNILPFHTRFRTLKTDLLGLKSNFSKYHFKTGTICVLFISSHLFTALKLMAIVLVSYPRDHNKNKPPIGKLFQKYKPIRHYFVMSRK